MYLVVLMTLILILLLILMKIIVWKLNSINTNKVDGGGANGYIRKGKRSNMYTIRYDYTRQGVSMLFSGETSLYHNELYTFTVNGVTLYKYGVIAIKHSINQSSIYAEYMSHNLHTKYNNLSAYNIGNLMFTPRHFQHVYKFGRINDKYSGGEIGAWLHVMEMAGHRAIYKFLKQTHFGCDVTPISDDNFYTSVLRKNGGHLIFTAHGAETSEFFAPINISNQNSRQIAQYVPVSANVSLSQEMDILNDYILYYQNVVVPVMLLRMYCINDNWKALNTAVRNKSISRQLLTNFQNSDVDNINISHSEYAIIARIMKFPPYIPTNSDIVIGFSCDVDTSNGNFQRNRNMIHPQQIRPNHPVYNTALQMPDIPVAWYDTIIQHEISSGEDGDNGAKNLILQQHLPYDIFLV